VHKKLVKVKRLDHTIIHFEIPAKNIENMKIFYETLFGWKIIHAPIEGMDYWVIQTVPTDEKGMLQRPGINGGMAPKQQPDQKPVNYIIVEDMDEYLKKVVALGGKVLLTKQKVPTVGYIALAVDPEGNQFGLIQTEMT
jgi:predicted enzyme related to lactoylglutathione lyase